MHPTFLAVTFTENEHHTIATISKPGLPSAVIALPLSLMGNRHLDPKQLLSELEKFQKEAERMVKRLSPAGFEEQAEPALKGVASALRAYAQRARAYKQEIDNSWVKKLTPPDDIDANRLAETRAYLRSLKSVADVTRVVLSDGIAAFAALQQPEGIAGMDNPAIRPHVERLVMLANVRRAYAAQGGYNLKPTLENPLAFGTDAQAVDAAAKAALAAHEGWLADIDAAAAIIKQTIVFYAVIANIKPSKAFENIGLDI